MSGMTMKRIIHQAQNLGVTGVRRSLDNPSAVLDTVVQWRRSRVAESHAPQVVAGVLKTVAERTKFPRRTRKRAMKTLKHAARELRRQSPAYQRKKKAWLVGGILAAATVGTILLVRTLNSRGYPEALGAAESTPVTSPRASDKVPGETLAENIDSRDHPTQENDEPGANHSLSTESEENGQEPGTRTRKNTGTASA